MHKKSSCIKTALRFFTVLLLMCCLVFSSCNKKNEDPASTVYLYYMTQNKIELFPVYGIIDLSAEGDVLIESIWSNLIKTPEKSSGYISCIPDTIRLLSFSIQDGTLILNFGSSYLEMSPVREVLVRAALVKTYSQLPFVNGVELRCDSQPLCDSDGNPYGAQKSSDFINPFGKGVDSYRTRDFRLYFPDSSGTHLEEYDCTLSYEYNIPIEQVIIERLIDDATPGNLLQGFSSEVKLLSVANVDSVCYVNFNNSFLQGATVSPDIAIYSIVNSLTELNDVTAVQFSVNGSTAVTFMEQYDLSVPLKRNLDFVKKAE